MRARGAAPWVAVGLVLLGFGLCLVPLGRNRFAEDEALYAYWGLQIASGADPMLDREPVDKPPLVPYLLALIFRVVGPAPVGRSEVLRVEAAARLMSVWASTAAIALAYRLGRRMGNDDWAGVAAAGLLALSSFWISFAATAFTDPLMATLALGALAAAAEGKPGTAGLLAGLAGAAKQQGLLFVPLVVALLAVQGRTAAGQAAPTGRAGPGSAGWVRFGAGLAGWVRFGAGLAAVTVGALAWDGARAQRPGFWEQGFISYGGLGPAAAGTLAERAGEWLGLAGQTWGRPWVTGLMLAVVCAWFVGSRLTERMPRPGPMDGLLAGFVLALLALHAAVGFQVWDRYLLGLVPVACVVAGRAIAALGSAAMGRRALRVAYGAGLAVAAIGLLAGPALGAARSEAAVGGDHGAYDGIDELAATLRERLPTGAVVYHHWLGYHYRFYLYGAPFRFHWYPDVEDLVQDATQYRREPRAIAFPSWRDSRPMERALAEAGIRLKPAGETRRRDGSVSFRLFEMAGP